MGAHEFVGTVVDRATQAGVPGVRVEAVDNRGIVRGLVTAGDTDADGVFHLTVTDDVLRSHFGSSSPVLDLRVVSATTVLTVAGRPQRWVASMNGTGRLEVVTGRSVGSTTTALPYAVEGTVTDPASGPLASTAVRVIMREVVDGTLVTETKVSGSTNARGHFLLSYQPSVAFLSLRARPDISVQALDGSGTVIAETRVARAVPKANVDLIVGGSGRKGRTTFTVLKEEAKDKAGGTLLHLVTGDLADTVKALSESRSASLDQVLAAHVLEATHSSVPAEVFYGLASQGLPTTPHDLFKHRRSSLQAALLSAVDRGHVSQSVQANIDTHLQALEDAAVEVLFEAPPSGVAIGTVVATTPTSTAAQQQQFVRLALRHDGSHADFWTAVQADGTLSALVPKLRLTVEAAPLVGAHPAMLTAIHAAGITEAKQLAGLTLSDWSTKVDAAGYPASTPGSSDAERKANYAQFILAQVEARFRTAVVASRVLADTSTALAPSRSFFSAFPDFDFEATRVARFIAETPSALTTLGSGADAAIAQMKEFERVHKLTDSYAETKTLFDAGLRSAEAIHKAGLANMPSGLASEVAANIFERACWAATTANALHLKWSGRLHTAQVATLPNFAALATSLAPSIADWATLFGSADACSCEHCRSVYGPAAYLVALLEFLATLPAPGGLTGRDLFLQKRPDVARIALSCSNAETPVPYTDLVCEILETRIGVGGGSWPTVRVQTEATAEELLADRELPHLTEYIAAYVALRDAIYPFELPFHLWEEEARTYLEHLGVPRHQLILALSAETPSTAPFVPPTIPPNWVPDRLRTSTKGAAVLTGTFSGPAPEAYWGLSSSYVASLASVPTFLDRAALSFDELRELAATAFWSSRSLLLNQGTECDVDTMTISGFDSTKLGQLNRFLRLSRQMSWSLTETDKAVSALGPVESHLNDIAWFEEVRQRLALDVADACSFYVDLDRVNAWVPSRFEKLFLDKSVAAPEAAVFQTILTSGTAAPETIGGHKAAIAAALGLEDAQLRLLVDVDGARSELYLPPAVPAASDLTVGALSRLARIADLARALGVRPSDLRVFAQISGANGLTGDGGVTAPTALPVDTALFLDAFDDIRASGLTVAEVHYVLRDVDSDRAPLRPAAGSLAQWRTAIVSSMQKAYAQAKNAPDTLTAGTETDPRAIATRSVVASVAAIFRLEAATASLLLTSGVITFGTTPCIDAFIPIVGGDTLPGSDDDRERLLARISKAALLIRKLSLTSGELGLLYRTPGSSSDGLPYLDLDTLPVAPPVDASSPAPEVITAFSNLLRLVRFAGLRDRWPSGSDGLLAVLAFASAPLPLSPVVGGYYDLLASQTGWGRPNIEALAARFGFPPGSDNTSASLAPFKNELPLLRFESAMRLISRIGATANDATQWVADLGDVTPAPETLSSWSISRDIKRLARSKYDAATWTTLARPLKDALREKQRSTLASYTVRTLGYQDTESIYENLYIDAEMSACQLTSRIVQAVGSVQQFVGRCLLNIESAAVDSDTARTWEWMRNYRVWEANRKVFLYPESYIEPDLRDDKTPLFRAFEKELHKGEITSDAATQAYQSYLEGLATLSELEVFALYLEPRLPMTPSGASGTDDILHLFGRTKRPAQYYYRKREEGRWSAWEKADLDVQGDHLIPIVFNGRLFAFWPIISEVAKTNTTFTDTPHTAENELAIRMAYSERRPEGWTPQRTSPENEAVRIGAVPFRNWLTFTASVVNQSVVIRALAFNSDYPTESVQTAQFCFTPCSPIAVGQNLTTLKQATVDLLEKEAPGYKEAIAQAEAASGVSIPVPKSIGQVNGFVETDTFVEPNAPISLPEGLDVYFQGYSGKARLRVPIRDEANQFESRELFSAERLFRLAFSRGPEPRPELPLFTYQDTDRTLLLTRHQVLATQASSGFVSLMHGQSILSDAFSTNVSYRVEVLHHPFVCAFQQAVAVLGVNALSRWSHGSSLQLSTNAISAVYQPTSLIESPFPAEEVDFSIASPFGIYNWELFFHMPLLIATRLMQNQRFEEARQWFHTIFDPTDGSSAVAPQRYWKVRPFYENKDLAQIQDELATLATSTYAKEIKGWADGGTSPSLDALLAQIREIQLDPFNPHAIARLRPLAYQKTVVLKYIENLLAWGDQLFAADSMESVNEATQLYVLASRILGRRPVTVPKSSTDDQSYAELSAIDAFGNAAVEVESIVPRVPALGRKCQDNPPSPSALHTTTYFCVPTNDKLLGLWDVVADRLFKIRHCMNIEGQVRQIPLFQPPIDPSLLVRAKAAGIDISTLLLDLGAKPPLYRYSVLLQKATEFAGAVQALGAELLAAQEKRDAEQLATLRAGQETDLLSMVLDSKRASVSEAKASLAALEESRRKTDERYRFYQQVLFLNASEAIAMEASALAQGLTLGAQGLRSSAAAVYQIPTITIGGAGMASPIVIAGYGGTNEGNSSSALAGSIEAAASAATFIANSASTVGGYLRRLDDWKREERIAKIELGELDKQVEAAEIRLAIAENDLTTAQSQIEQSRAIESYYRSKFTNQELYDWMLSESATIYFETYKLAYDMAKRAERAFQLERGDESQSFVRFGSWDSLRRGLLAGERLSLDLRRLDAAYHSQNARELELSKSISLARIAPEQVLALREIGSASFSISEAEFDRDHPAHYFRRLKSVAVTVPCTTGPYQGVHATLTLQSGQTRKTDTSSASPWLFTPTTSIVTSNGDGDAGLFELNLRDDRLLPFEGAGAHSTDANQWQFALAAESELPFESISDLVLQLRYTARAGVTSRATASSRHALFDVRAEFADAWYAFTSSITSDVQIPLTSALLPGGRTTPTRTVKSVSVFAKFNGSLSASLSPPTATPPPSPLSLSGPSVPWPGVPGVALQKWSATGLSLLVDDATPNWSLSFSTSGSSPLSSIQECWLIVDYETGP